MNQTSKLKHGIAKNKEQGKDANAQGVRKEASQFFDKFSHIFTFLFESSSSKSYGILHRSFPDSSNIFDASFSQEDIEG